ncbi:alanine racemase [Altererythrobacter sp. FM1]|uniref:Alanine racemase n=1 Tax=Tsuneonella flava TaxID=2055955 RepID=A0ABX7K8X1_9SPHN|nr:alanine racemase [Tsuneonella flava]QSB44685.1 alanine racemase [Tsuneonella flava]ROT93756.1 alanine racemase [Altererythrobacter sp. FM1]UBS33125.1 alanine racemase [Altererythrobacter sp. N1]
MAERYHQYAASSIMEIDLDALRANYREISCKAEPAQCGAVVKANAYGLGACRVVPALQREGCRLFFVAQLCEAIAIEPVLGPDSTVYVLNGIDPGDEALCADHGFFPVINSTLQLRNWRTLARERGQALPAALQVDSGMSRLGLPAAVAADLARDPSLRREIDFRLLMTHLACADEPTHPANRDQLATFSSLSALFPDVPSSIANSAGSILAKAFHCNAVRPGIALYGVDPGPGTASLLPVVRLSARVLQIRKIVAGTGVGYGLTHVAPGAQRLATIAIGYADGWPRSLSGIGAAYFNGIRLPIAGRVSMDSMTVCLDALTSQTLSEGDFVELIGPSQTLADVARDADTIAYEILTRIGSRHQRIYSEQGDIEVLNPGELV